MAKATSLDSLVRKIHIEKQKEQLYNEAQIKASQLPQVPKTLLEWTLMVRPTIEGSTNYIRYLPMYIQLYEDQWDDIHVLFPRQAGKSAYDVSCLGFMGTTVPNSRQALVTHEQEEVSTFSIEKFRQNFWDESPIARKFLRRGEGAVGLFQTKINSTMRIVTDARNFKHVEGKSLHQLIFDEGSLLDLESWVSASETQSFTQGLFKMTGRGGYLNTAYHKWYLDSDQREFIFSKNWERQKDLQFRKSGRKRLVFDEYMLDVLDGHWRATHPENGSRHGYHLTQYQLPWIPLKKWEATDLYGIPERYSIQWKLENLSSLEFEMHINAGFVQGSAKPITTAMMGEIFDPNMRFLGPDEVDHEKGPVFTGIDFGGAYNTVIFTGQEIRRDGLPSTYDIIKIERSDTSDEEAIFQLCKNHIDAYRSDQVIMDAGGADYPRQQLESQYGTRCIKFFYLNRPARPHLSDVEIAQHFAINSYSDGRTESLDNVVRHVKDKLLRIPYMIPEDVKFVEEHFTNIFTKLVTFKGRKDSTRVYEHSGPDHTFHAANYMLIAADIHNRFMKGEAAADIADEFGF